MNQRPHPIPSSSTSSTGSSTSEGKSQRQLIEEFTRFAVQFLKSEKQCAFKQCPRLTLTKNKAATQTLGHNDVGNHHIVVYSKGRNLADVCRTIGHELVHSAQAERGELMETSGETGSPHENEANALAGVLLRHFGKISPEIYHRVWE